MYNVHLISQLVLTLKGYVITAATIYTSDKGTKACS